MIARPVGRLRTHGADLLLVPQCVGRGPFSMGWLLCGEKKRDLTSLTVPQKKDICNRPQSSPLGIYLHYGKNTPTISVNKKTETMVTDFFKFEKINSATEKSVIISAEMVL